jgi:hypothetical protein
MGKYTEADRRLGDSIHKFNEAIAQTSFDSLYAMWESTPGIPRIDPLSLLKAQIDHADESRDLLMSAVADAIVVALHSGMTEAEIARVLLRKTSEVLGEPKQ